MIRTSMSFRCTDPLDLFVSAGGRIYGRLPGYGGRRNGHDVRENAFISLVAKDLNPNITVLAVASSARSIRRLKFARADIVFASAAVGSRLPANLIEGNPIPAEFRDLLEGKLRDA